MLAVDLILLWEVLLIQLRKAECLKHQCSCRGILILSTLMTANLNKHALCVCYVIKTRQAFVVFFLLQLSASACGLLFSCICAIQAGSCSLGVHQRRSCACCTLTWSPLLLCLCVLFPVHSPFPSSLRWSITGSPLFRCAQVCPRSERGVCIAPTAHW